LYALRNDCEINSAKYGCGAGQCGACTVIVNGNQVRSCITPISAIKGNITTLEDYQNDPVLKALNKSFIAEQAAQCGFCIAGMMMSAKGLLDKNKNLIPELTIAQIHALIADGTITGGMIPKVETCIYALEQGVEGVVILDGKVPHSVLLELLTDHGAGTLITR
jgi:aerobic-type carbon monoxide dehydrogenase small subunit (CoxS/CutS family)